MSVWKPLSAYFGRLLLIIFFATPEPVELGSGLAALAYGGWMCVPGLFQRYSRFYATLARLAPAGIWGGCLITFGVLQIIACLRARRQTARELALLVAMGWLFLGMIYLRADWHAPVIGLFLVGFLANGWIYIRLGGYWPLPDEGDDDAIHATPGP